MADENPEPDQYARLNQRLDQLESVIYQQISRIFELEKRLGINFTPPEPVIEATSPPVETQPEAVAQWPSEPKPGSVPEIKTPVIEPAPAPAEPKPPWFRLPEAKDLESMIGGNWFNRIGILAIILAVGFFIKYAFENQWIGPAGRIMIGIAIGIGFLLGGERLRGRGYRHYAHGLSGGGIAILYLAIFAAFGRYHLIGQLPAFAFMSLITATAVLLSARYDALAIAVLGLIGGFLTLIPFSTGRDNQTGLFSYIIVLNLGVLALAWFKQWRILNYLAFVATVLMSAGWLSEWYAPEKLWKTVFFFTVLFVIFALLAVLHNVIYRQRVIALDVALILINAGLYFGTCYRLLEPEQQSVLGLFAILVSAFYLGLGYVTWQRDREDRYLVLTFIGLASLFLTLAIPIQLDQHWTTMAWAIEGAILVWIAQRTGSRLTHGAALVVFVVALLHWLKFDLVEFSFRAGETFTPLLNKRGASSLVLIAALAVAVRLLKSSGNFEAVRRLMMMSCLIAAAALLLVWLSFDIRDYFEAARFPFRERIDREPALWNAITRLDSIKHLCLTALWSVFASLLLTGGFRRRLTALRIAGLALLAMTLGKVILLDTQYYAALWRTLILNPVFGSFAMIVAALAFSYLSYARAGETAIRERNDVLNGLLAAGNLAALIGLCVEASGHFTARMQLSDPSRSWFEAVMRDFSLTAIISIYGAVMLGLALKRNRLWLQVASLALLAVASLKVILIDLTGAISGRPLIFNPVFGGFVVVIASLALGLRALSRSGSGETWQKRSIQIVLIVINFLGLIALSAESNNYFDGRLTQFDLRSEEWQNLYLARQLSLSIIWGVYGGAMLMVGIWRRNRLARIMALGILGMTIVKVFFIDLSSLDQLYRIISFVMLGIVLLVVSYVYQRLMKSAEGGQP